MPAFLLKNPLASALGIGLGLLLLAASIALGVQTVRLATRTAELATEKLAFSDFKKDLAEQSVRVMEAAARKSAEKVGELLTDIRNASAVATETKTEIRYVQSNGGPCVADPAWRATIGGVQRILDAGGAGGQAGQAGPKPAPVVRRTATP